MHIGPPSTYFYFIYVVMMVAISIKTDLTIKTEIMTRLICVTMSYVPSFVANLATVGYFQNFVMCILA